MTLSRTGSHHADASSFALPRIVIGILDGRYEGALDYALNSAMHNAATITMVSPRLGPPLISWPPLDVEEFDGDFESKLVTMSNDADRAVIQVPDQVADRLTDPRLMRLRRETQCVLIEVDSAGQAVRASGPASGELHESNARVANGRPLIVAGVDGSEGSGVVVDWANAEALVRGAQLRLVVAMAEGMSRQKAQAIVRAARDRTSVEAESVVAAGEPVDTLVNQSVGADLLVVGGHSTSGLIHSALGGVGDSCARLAECPVVIVPRARVAKPAQTGTDQ